MFLSRQFQYSHSFWLLCCFEHTKGFFLCFFVFLGGGLKNCQGKDDSPSQLEFFNAFIEYNMNTEKCLILSKQHDEFSQTEHSTHIHMTITLPRNSFQSPPAPEGAHYPDF